MLLIRLQLLMRCLLIQPYEAVVVFAHVERLSVLAWACCKNSTPISSAWLFILLHQS